MVDDPTSVEWAAEELRKLPYVKNVEKFFDAVIIEFKRGPCGLTEIFRLLEIMAETGPDSVESMGIARIKLWWD